MGFHGRSLVIDASVQISICNFCKKSTNAGKDFSKLTIQEGEQWHFQ